MILKVIHRCLGRFRDAFHQLFLADGPHVVRADSGVDLGLADAAIGAANANVLVGTAKAAHRVALKVGQHQHGIIVQLVGANVHFGKPLAVLYRQGCHAVLVHNIHWAERPAVYFQGFAVLCGGVAVALVIGIGFHNGAVGDLFHQALDPGTRDDVGAVLLAGVQLNSHLAGQVALNGSICLFQALCRKITGKKHNGFAAGALCIWLVILTANACFNFTHGKILLASVGNAVSFPLCTQNDTGLLLLYRFLYVFATFNV
jgi:hypothetical protein